AFDLRFGRGAEGMGANGQFAGQFARAENLYSRSLAIGQSGLAERFEIDARAVLESIKRFEIDGDIPDGVPRVVEPALGNAADQRHLGALEADANGTARTGRLPFAAAARGFAVTARFALAKTLAAMLSARTWFE